MSLASGKIAMSTHGDPAMTRRLRSAASLAAALLAAVLVPPASAQTCPFDPRCLNNPFGAGNPYKADGLMNPYSRHGSPYSNDSHTNPFATNAPKLYDQQGTYRGRLSANPYDPDSTSNPFGRYGNPHSPDSINNPFGAGNPFGAPLRVVPQ